MVIFIMKIITGHYTIKQIFKDHWSKYLEKHLETPNYIKKEVRKMLSCRDYKKMDILNINAQIIQKNIKLFLILVKADFAMFAGLVKQINGLMRLLLIFQILNIYILFLLCLIIFGIFFVSNLIEL